MQIELFVGAELNPSVKKALDSTNPHVVKLFTSGSPYLDIVHHEGKSYIGKPLEYPTKIQELELLSMNIMSLLKRLGANNPSESLKCLVVWKTPSS